MWVFFFLAESIRFADESQLDLSGTSIVSSLNNDYTDEVLKTSMA